MGTNAGGFRIPDKRPGDSILTAWRELKLEVRDTAVVPGPGILLARRPGGTVATPIPRANRWPHPWRPSLGAGVVALNPGRVNGLMTRIDGVPMDDPSAPVYELTADDHPSDDLESWLVVQVTVDPDTKKIPDLKENPDALKLVHVSALDPRYRDGLTLDDNGKGREAVAFLKWADRSTVAAVFPIATHHLKHEFKPADAKHSRGRHWFYP